MTIRPQIRKGAETLHLGRMLDRPQRRKDAEGLHMDRRVDGSTKGRKWHSMVAKRRGAE